MTGRSVNVDAAREARKAGLSWRQIALQQGVDVRKLRYWADPLFDRRSYGNVHVRDFGPDRFAANRDGEVLLSKVPSDTRGLTARMCGDPLPGRSALDRKRGAIR